MSEYRVQRAFVANGREYRPGDTIRGGDQGAMKPTAESVLARRGWIRPTSGTPVPVDVAPEFDKRTTTPRRER
jgi:hypothetical protein